MLCKGVGPGSARYPPKRTQVPRGSRTRTGREQASRSRCELTPHEPLWWRSTRFAAESGGSPHDEPTFPRLADDLPQRDVRHRPHRPRHPSRRCHRDRGPELPPSSGRGPLEGEVEERAAGEPEEALTGLRSKKPRLHTTANTRPRRRRDLRPEDARRARGRPRKEEHELTKHTSPSGAGPYGDRRRFAFVVLGSATRGRRGPRAAPRPTLLRIEQTHRE